MPTRPGHPRGARGAARRVPRARLDGPAAAARRAHRLPRLRRRARGRAPARRPARRPRAARRRDVDHRRAGGLRPLAPAGHADRQRVRPARRDRRRARRALRRGGRPARRQRSPTARRPLDEPLVDAARSRRPAARGHARRWAAAPTSRPSRWPRSTSSPATSSRSCWRSASTSTSRPIRSTSTGCCARSTRARTCTSCADPR